MIDIKALQDKILILQHDLQVTRQGYYRLANENAQLKQKLEDMHNENLVGACRIGD
ncbi:hypothetical protein J2736_006748 [Paenibacillus qinlingensis]|uniref:Uncharacterized protein n=1 Tax=Paenibacillus qinlingensis TaxID=1837343 RepID=A0ABU1P833_9BACL|nr:hypothetical protein [Paenibacillus qinlingensis]